MAVSFYINDFDASYGNINFNGNDSANTSNPCVFNSKFTLVPDPLGSGNQCLRIFQDPGTACLTSDGKHRALIAPATSLNGSYYLIQKDVETWIGYRIFIPEAFNIPTQYDPVYASARRSGGQEQATGRSNITNGASNTVRLSVDEVYSTSPGVHQWGRQEYLYLTKGVWHQIVIRAKWSSDTTGYYEQYLDGTRIINWQGIKTCGGYPEVSGNFKYDFGMYWGTEIRTGHYELYFDDIRMATGPDGYNTVTPQETTTIPAAPSGATLVDGAWQFAGAGAAEWAQATNTTSIGGDSYYVKGELQTGGTGNTTYAYKTIYTPTTTGDIDVWFYSDKRVGTPGRATNIQWQLRYVGGAQIATGTVDESGTVNENFYLGKYAINSVTPIELRILNNGCTAWVKADAMYYKWSASPPVSPPSIPVQGSFAQAIPSRAKNLDPTTHDYSVIGPITGGTGDTYVQVSNPVNCDVSASGKVATVQSHFGKDSTNSTISYVVTPFDSVGVYGTSRTVTLTITNSAPTTTVKSVDANPGTTTNIDISGWGADADGDSLTRILTTASHNGCTGVINGSVLEITAPAGGGTYTLAYKVNDGTADSNISNITVNVAASADTPVANNFTINMIRNQESASVNFRVNCYYTAPIVGAKIDGGACTNGSGFIPIANGYIQNVGELWEIVNIADYVGTYQFTYTVTNGVNESTPGTVTVNVTQVPITSDHGRKSFTVDNTTRSVNLRSEFGIAAGSEDVSYSLLSAPEGFSVEGSSLVYPYQANGAFRELHATVRTTYDGASSPVDLDVYVVVSGPAPNVRGVKWGRRV